MTRRHELTDAQWRLAPLLPPQKPDAGHPNLDHRTIVTGLLWRLRTAAPWRDIPERYGTWSTIYSRFRRRREAGIWEQAPAAVQAMADARGDLDWLPHFVDGTVVRAHPHAAGAQKGAATRPWAAAGAASAPRSTCGPKATASP